MLNSVEKTFSVSAAKLSAEHSDEQSARAKLGWGIALLVISQVLSWIVILASKADLESASYYEVDDITGKAILWLLVAGAMSIVGTVLLIVGIVNSVRCGKRVAALSKCKLRVSSDAIYGATFNNASGTARSFSVAPQQITELNVSGNTLAISAGNQVIRVTNLASPYDAMRAIIQQRELMGLPMISSNSMDAQYVNQQAVPQMMPQQAYQQAYQQAPVNSAPQAPAQRSTSQMKFCTECGGQIPESSRFCPKCGAPQE